MTGSGDSGILLLLKLLFQIQEISDELSDVKLNIADNQMKKVRATVKCMAHDTQP